MTKKDVLQKAIDLANHNVFCYSANYLMTEAKAGYEKEHKEAIEEARLLEEILQEVCGEKEKPANDKPADQNETLTRILNEVTQIRKIIQGFIPQEEELGNNALCHIELDIEGFNPFYKGQAEKAFSKLMNDFGVKIHSSNPSRCLDGNELGQPNE